MMLVTAVRECSSKELVTYGVRVLTIPELKADTNWITQILDTH